MATTKLLVAGCAALIATGFTFGLGWMTTGSAATNPSVAAAKSQTQQDATPVRTRPDAQPKAPNPPDRTERLKMLREQSARIDREVRDLQQRHSELSQMEVGLIDLSALQAELFATDKQILAVEKQAHSWERTLEANKKQAEEAPKNPIDERSVIGGIDSDPTVSQTTVALQNAERTLANLKSKVTSESAVVIAATKEVARAEAALKIAREVARPRVMRQIRANQAERWAESLASTKRLLESKQSELKDLWEARKQLAARIAERKQVSEKQQAINDELSVLRELRLDVLRMQTIAELGLDLSPAVGRRLNSEAKTEPRLGDNSQEKMEAQLKELRQEIETLRNEVKKLQRKR